MKNILMIGGSYGIGLPLVKILNKDYKINTNLSKRNSQDESNIFKKIIEIIK